MFIPGASNSAERIDSTFAAIIAIEVALLAVVTVAMIAFVIRYRRKKNPRPENIEGSPLLEILWTAIPTVLVLIMFYIGWKSFVHIRQVPGDVLPVRVIARQWSWEFRYENGIGSDVLRIPVNRPVKLILTSQDVIHSFYVPHFRIKEDCVPGMETYLWFTPNALGSYDIFCTEYCGLGHSRMLSKAVVLSAEEFAKWYAAVPEAEDEGLRLLSEKGCLGCHSTDGTRKIGPTLKGVFGRKEIVLTGGKERTITVDEGYLRRALHEPQADVVKEFPPVMPKIALSPEETEKIVTYLKQLK